MLREQLTGDTYKTDPINDQPQVIAQAGRFTVANIDWHVANCIVSFFLSSAAPPRPSRQFQLNFPKIITIECLEESLFWSYIDSTLHPPKSRIGSCAGRHIQWHSSWTLSVLSVFAARRRQSPSLLKLYSTTSEMSSDERIGSNRLRRRRHYVLLTGNRQSFDK